MTDFRALIADDAFAASFQSLGQYRTALLAALTQPEPQADGEVAELVAELREKFEQLIKCSRAYDGYSTMTPVELADRLIDAVLKLEAGNG
jgi:hypothetical protein